MKTVFKEELSFVFYFDGVTECLNGRGEDSCSCFTLALENYLHASL